MCGMKVRRKEVQYTVSGPEHNTIMFTQTTSAASVRELRSVACEHQGTPCGNTSFSLLSAAVTALHTQPPQRGTTPLYDGVTRGVT